MTDHRTAHPAHVLAVALAVAGLALTGCALTERSAGSLSQARAPMASTATPTPPPYAEPTTPPPATPIPFVVDGGTVVPCEWQPTNNPDILHCVPAAAAPVTLIVKESNP
jgi:hypothetical protein